VAKGWLADRALALLDPYPSALVDGDGDLALRLAPGTSWCVGVADPREPGSDLLVLAPSADTGGPSRHFGIATSGTSIHRWERGNIRAHHLIDPRSGRPAWTDVIQATVMSTTARHAEAFAKAAVILGSEASLGMLDRPEVLAAALLTDRGDLLATPGTVRWMA
jgi:thiamine biosynthesis lipoprotein